MKSVFWLKILIGPVLALAALSITFPTVSGPLVASLRKPGAVSPESDLVLAGRSVSRRAQTILMGTVDQDAGAIQPAVGGGAVIAGGRSWSSAGGNGCNAMVLKLDASGAISWQHCFGMGPGNDFETHAAALTRCPDGNYLLVGYEYDVNMNIGDYGDIFSLKLASDGNVEWFKKYPAQGADEAFCVEATPDGGYVVAGDTWSFGVPSKAGWVLKLDAQGDVVWQTAVGGSADDARYALYAIRSLPQGGYLAVGEVDDWRANSWKAWVVRLGNDGQVRWQKTYGDDIHQWALNSICPAGGGAFVLAGNRYFEGDNDGVWAIKLNRTGGITWRKCYPDEAISQTVGIFPSAGGHFWLVGTHLLLKIGPTGALAGPGSFYLDPGIAGASQDNDGSLLLNGTMGTDLEVMRLGPIRISASDCPLIRRTSVLGRTARITAERVFFQSQTTWAGVSDVDLDGWTWPFLIQTTCGKMP